MKLSEQVADGIGYREVLEREALAHKARVAAREAATKRLEALRAAVGPSAAVEAVLAAVEADPERFLDPKVHTPPVAPKKPPANMQRSPGMIGNNRATIGLHLLAVTRMVRLLGPLDDATANALADVEAAYQHFKPDIEEYA